MKLALHDEYLPAYKRFSYLYIPALYLFTAVMLDVVMFSFMDTTFPSHYIYSFVLMLGVAGLVCLSRRKWLQLTILSVLLGLQLFTCIANIVTYATLYEVFSLETIISIGNVVGAASSIDVNMAFVLPVLGVMLIFVVGVMLIMAKCYTPLSSRRCAWQPFLCLALGMVCLFSQTTSYITLAGYQSDYVKNLSNTKFMYDTYCNRVINLQSFGSYSFYLNNFLYLLSLQTPLADALDVEIRDFEPVAPALEEQYQLDDDTNLIMILMETVELGAINPILTPNLYDFMHDKCWSVDGYYSVERTCFTDYIGQTGLHAIGREMWSNYGNVEIPFSLGHMFKRKGYAVNAFHDYSGKSYQRRKLFTRSLGFDNFYDYEDYDTERYHDWAQNSDKNLFEQNLTRIAPDDQKFYSYVISISTHAISPEHDLRSVFPQAFNEIDKNLDALVDEYHYGWLKSDDPQERQAIYNYLAGTYTFDQGFGALLKHLQDTPDQRHAGKKLIETTAIVMFGDHYSYMSPNMVTQDPDLPNPQNLAGHKCPFIIYNPKNPTPQTIQRFMSTMDIYKSVCDLFGVTTDAQITYGHSVFGAEQSIGVGYMNGFIWGQTDDGKIWRTTDFKKFTGKQLTPAEIEQVTPLVVKTFDSIVANMSLLDKNGFKNLAKCKNGIAYEIRAA